MINAINIRDLIKRVYAEHERTEKETQSRQDLSGDWRTWFMDKFNRLKEHDPCTITKEELIQILGMGDERPELELLCVSCEQKVEQAVEIISNQTDFCNVIICEKCLLEGLFKIKKLGFKPETPNSVILDSIRDQDEWDLVDHLEESIDTINS